MKKSNYFLCLLLGFSLFSVSPAFAHSGLDADPELTQAIPATTFSFATISPVEIEGPQVEMSSHRVNMTSDFCIEVGIMAWNEAYNNAKAAGQSESQAAAAGNYAEALMYDLCESFGA